MLDCTKFESIAAGGRKIVEFDEIWICCFPCCLLFALLKLILLITAENENCNKTQIKHKDLRKFSFRSILSPELLLSSLVALSSKHSWIQKVLSSYWEQSSPLALYLTFSTRLHIYFDLVWGFCQGWSEKGKKWRWNGEESKWAEKDRANICQVSLGRHFIFSGRLELCKAREKDELEFLNSL